MENLTNEDIKNLIAFINRSQITGLESDVATSLKIKLSKMISTSSPVTGTEVNIPDTSEPKETIVEPK